VTRAILEGRYRYRGKRRSNDAQRDRKIKESFLAVDEVIRHFHRRQAMKVDHPTERLHMPPKLPAPPRLPIDRAKTLGFPIDGNDI
jgi:hypothetical protein